MLVRHLALSDFRNYETLDVELVAGPNVFVGSNGQGKTNLVEAIGFLSTLGSHRVSTDAALVRQGQESAIVRARLEHGDRAVLAEVQINRSGSNRAQINRSPIKVRELTRYFASVLFAPEDLAIVRGEPSGRRRLLDELLVQRSPRFAGVISDYDRALRQRNTLLKSARATRISEAALSTLDVWDARLVEFGSELMAARGELVAALSPRVGDAYATIAGADHAASLATQLSIRSSRAADDDDLDLDAVSDVAIPREQAATEFAAALDRLRRTELERGLTLTGPHRDDLVLTLNGMPARTHASHGESWSFALAVKLAAASLLREESTAGDPVLVLDDVFAELDEARRSRLAAAVGGFEQVLITAAVLGDVPEALAAHIVRIEAGRVVG